METLKNINPFVLIKTSIPLQCMPVYLEELFMVGVCRDL